MNIKDDFILSQINEGYLVGGAVRDFLLGKTTCDRDITIKNAFEFAQKLAVKFEATFITLDEENKIYRLVLPDKENYLDISEIQGYCIEDDLKRRDFTINAIAYDLQNNKFVDTTGGIEDLKSGILRHISDKNFQDDPLRILRAFRFYALTGFKMTSELENVLGKYLHLALMPAPERINYELMKLFGGKYTSKALLKMDKIGLLEMIFPYVKEMKQIPPNSHHHLDLFHHAVETTEQIETYYLNSNEEVKMHLECVDFGGFPRINHLKLAGFLHDIGKYSCWTIESENCAPHACKICQNDSRTCGIRQRFIKHDDVGSKMVVGFLRNLKFSKKQIEYISGMIKNHIYPSSVISSPELNEKVMMRYIRKMDNDVIDNIILAVSDRLSARGIAISDEVINNNLQGLEKLLNFYLEKKPTLKPLPKLLDGNEIMQILGIKQSPLLGKIIVELKEAQLDGYVNTKYEAINFIKKFSATLVILLSVVNIFI